MSHHFGGQFPPSNSQQQQQQQQQQQEQLLNSMQANLAGQGGLNSMFSPSLDRMNNTSSLDSHIADIFSRRTTTSTLDDLLSRRGNSSSSGAGGLDDSTAVLDACILDLTRRRIGIMGGGSSASGAGGGGFDMTAPSQQSTMANAGPMSLGGGGGSSAASVAASASTIALRQQQLQKQHFELEQRQKELERQRQQLLVGIQETSMQASGLKASLEQQANSSSPGQQQQQQWWVCQLCNSKAFASREEAMHHEVMCSGDPSAKAMNLPGQPGGPSLSTGAGGMGVGGMQGNLPNMSSNMGSGGPSVDNGSTYNGPFTVVAQSLPLAMESDKDWLTPLHCFVRRHCVHVFCATAKDVTAPAKGKRKPIQVGQVGIRCPHCHAQPGGARERGSVYYPTSIASIYNATMNLLQRHLHSCTAVPEDIMARYQNLKADDARSGTSKKYWVESALSLGLVNTPSGIRFSAQSPPPLPRLSRQQHSTGALSANRRNSNDMFSTKSNADYSKQGMTSSVLANDMDQLQGSLQERTKEVEVSEGAPLVSEEDRTYATAFSFQLMSQMRSCVFTEADRLGKRKGLPPGFAGLACRHCYGGYGSGRFFPSSIKTLSDTSKTLNVVHNHMLRCRKCPTEVKESLEKLRTHHDAERAKMKFGSQKAFFAKIWRRLHDNDGPSLQRDIIANKRNHISAFPMPNGNNTNMLMKSIPQGMDWPNNNYNIDPNKRQRLGQF